MAFGVLLNPAFLMLCWAVPWIAVVGNRSANGYPVYSPIGFLFGPLAMGCWVAGWLGVLLSVVGFTFG